MDDQILNRFRESVLKENKELIECIKDEKEKDGLIDALAISKYDEFLYHKEQIESMKSKERMGFMDRLCARLFSKE